MYNLACRDAGLDCNYMAKGQTREEAMKMGMEHVKKAHPEKVAEMEKMPKEEVMALIKES